MTSFHLQVQNALLTSYSGPKTRLHAKGFVVPMGGTIVYRTFSNYNELCTKYHLLSMFFYKSYHRPTKGGMFSHGQYNVLTIYINFTKNASTAFSVIICRVGLYYKATEFLYINQIKVNGSSFPVQVSGFPSGCISFKYGPPLCRDSSNPLEDVDPLYVQSLSSWLSRHFEAVYGEGG